MKSLEWSWVQASHLELEQDVWPDEIQVEFGPMKKFTRVGAQFEIATEPLEVGIARSPLEVEIAFVTYRAEDGRLLVVQNDLRLGHD